MKTRFTLLVCILISINLYAQNTTTVNALGVGLNRTEALKDALRNAVAQGVGVAITSSSTVENYMLLKDAIATRTDGVVSSYKVVSEVPLANRYEINIEAVVSLDPIKQSANALQQLVGGIRFLVLYNDKKVKNDADLYDFATERVNEKLKINNYRYIEKDRFNDLKAEAARLLVNDTSQVAYVQKLGLFADAQFLIQISNINVRNETKADGVSSIKVSIEVKVYDNCVAEGLGTVVMESEWKSGKDVNDVTRLAITDAIDKGYNRLFLLFNKSIADWANNGGPFELRFYDVGKPRELRPLIELLQKDNSFGGTLEPVQTMDFVKINCTFNNSPYKMYTTVLDYCDAIPALKDKTIDIRLQYGRQLSFAPDNVAVPELDQIKKIYANERK